MADLINQSERDKTLSRAIVWAHKDGDIARAQRLTKMLREERKVTQTKRVAAGLAR